MAIFNHGQIRKSIHTIEDIESLLDKDTYPITKSKSRKAEINGEQINYYNLHYHTFFHKSDCCAFCGLLGSFYALEHNKNQDGYCLYLYGLDANKDEVMITYCRLDESSESNFDNVQPICRKCWLLRQREGQSRKGSDSFAVKSLKEVAEEYPVLFDGTPIKPSKIIAFCNNSRHRGWISHKLAEEHKCIKKNCNFYEKANPAYWNKIVEQQNKARALRSQSRIQKKSVKARNAFIHSFFELYKDVYITSIKEDSHGLTILYIYDKRVDLSKEIEILRKKLDCKIYMKAVPTTLENKINLIRKKSKPI